MTLPVVKQKTTKSGTIAWWLWILWTIAIGNYLLSTVFWRKIQRTIMHGLIGKKGSGRGKTMAYGLTIYDRQWVVKRFNLWNQDLTYTDDMILMDVRNNSAWNYRYYVLFSNPDQPSKETLNQEVEFTKNKIQLAPNNSSGWSYLTA